MLNDVEILQYAAAIAAACAVLLWILPNPKCICKQCSYHVNERRVSAMREREAVHDAQHKGFGFKPGAPDYMHCDDPLCSRNPKA